MNGDQKLEGISHDYIVSFKRPLLLKYQPSGEGSTHSLPATPHHLLNTKWPTGSEDKSNRMLLDP